MSVGYNLNSYDPPDYYYDSYGTRITRLSTRIWIAIPKLQLGSSQVANYLEYQFHEALRTCLAGTMYETNIRGNLVYMVPLHFLGGLDEDLVRRRGATGRYCVYVYGFGFEFGAHQIVEKERNNVENEAFNKFMNVYRPMIARCMPISSSTTGTTSSITMGSSTSSTDLKSDPDKLKDSLFKVTILKLNQDG